MKIVVFGTGQDSTGIEYACLLYGFYIVAYLDNDPNKVGLSRHGKPIIFPSDVKSICFDRVVTASFDSQDEMRKQLYELGVQEEKILNLPQTQFKFSTGSEGKQILVFGTGQSSTGIEHACLLHGFNIVAYIDNDPKKIGAIRHGRPIIAPSDIYKFSYDRVVTASIAFQDEMRKQLVELGVPDGKISSIQPPSGSWLKGGSYLIHYRHSIDSDGSSVQTETEGFEMTGISSVDIPPPVDTQTHEILLKRLIVSLDVAEQEAKTCSEPYQTGENWHNFLIQTRPEYHSVRLNNDFEGLSKLLSNFCRNEMSSGILGGREAFEAYIGHPGMEAGIRANFNIWAYSIGAAPLHELASPLIGNPYGHLIDGHIIHPNTFLNHYRGCMVRKLVDGIDRPVIAEIGGGFGGFAFYVKKFIPDSCYINYDLPENLLISSYFLSLAYPDLRIHYYTGQEDMAELIKTHDIILMPNHALPLLPDRSVDLFVNTISLSEMSYLTITEYLSQITRTCDKFFYHENLIENGTGYLYYPIDTFPLLPDFMELSRQPSRWPYFSSTSPQHCHVEQLYLRRDRFLLSNGTPK